MRAFCLLLDTRAIRFHHRRQRVQTLLGQSRKPFAGRDVGALGCNHQATGESYELGETEARAIPSRLVLGRDEVAELEKIIVTNTPTPPPAPSSEEDAAAQETA